MRTRCCGLADNIGSVSLLSCLNRGPGGRRASLSVQYAKSNTVGGTKTELLTNERQTRLSSGSSVWRTALLLRRCSERPSWNVILGYLRFCWVYELECWHQGGQFWWRGQMAPHLKGDGTHRCVSKKIVIQNLNKTLNDFICRFALLVSLKIWGEKIKKT